MVETIRWPSGIEEIRTSFEDPRPYIIHDGERVSDAWPASILTPISLPEPLVLSWGPVVRRIFCHRHIAHSLQAVLQRINDRGLWHALNPYAGCYCWRRKVSNGSILSAHAWGIAVDFRVATCRYGTPGDMPAAIVQAFEDVGAEWGGRWLDDNCDPQHFQFCRGY